MKVKIGDTMYDSGEQPLMVILSEAERAEIAALPKDESMYCCYPAHLDTERVELWMHKQITAQEIEQCSRN